MPIVDSRADIVVDANVLIFAALDVGPRGADLRARLDNSRCHAPHLIDAEFGNVLRKMVGSGKLNIERAEVARIHGPRLINYRYSHHGSIGDSAWRLRDNLSYYDSLYVTLAAGLGISLFTADRRLSNSPGLPCRVEPIEF
ncbi:type II toxin-antitoxin system VapC family toxin [Antrihabitans cavernicola]|uniref:Ribonuclease VapC n=1 Tax=Antrihabitans cavernicola TaxID=2495913 RepID=A0A5A7SCL3_9NOCA|nr:type II toxin-antitoxin system VapC family toxin [Spelaeibacter cavernicola]KAA0022333.1 type II toxin-antitoxin system VapC family toxin [Spelaeibacter cavernicola]